MLKALIFLRLVDKDTRNLRISTIGSLLLVAWIGLTRKLGSAEVAALFVVVIGLWLEASTEEKARKKAALDATEATRLWATLGELKAEVGDLRTKVSQVSVASVMRPR